MYGSLLLIHSAVRWLVLLGIIVVLARTFTALLRPRPFSRGDRLAIALGTTASPPFFVKSATVTAPSCASARTPSTVAATTNVRPNDWLVAGGFEDIMPGERE